jgi:hypothetical protein
MMKRTAYLLVLLLALPTLAFAQPAITFESEQHDFGTVPDFGAVEHTFVFTNTGAEDLIILKLESG